MDDYFNFAEILQQTNFLRSHRIFERGGFNIRNRSDIIIPNRPDPTTGEDETSTKHPPAILDSKQNELDEYLCSDLKFDFKTGTWTDDKAGLQIIF